VTSGGLADAGRFLRALVRSIRGLGPFFRNYRAIHRQAAKSRGEFPFRNLSPCLDDRFKAGGVASGHYFHQDLHVAQLIFRNQPRRHVDVGSRVDGFVAHVASFRPIEVLDIRPMRSTIPNIISRQADVMAEPFPLETCCDSLSCLHALEHFGLGRYGDPVDYYGYQRGWRNLHRMLEPGGKLYFSVPIGPQGPSSTRAACSRCPTWSP
jgi:SAM-dependent methyltransferase